MTLQLQEPSRVDEPHDGKEYADVVSRVAAEHHAVIVRRDGADVAAIVPLEYLEMVLDELAREEAQAILRQLDLSKLAHENPPPQAWFDGDEPKPF
jgi:hypothetical protein